MAKSKNSLDSRIIAALDAKGWWPPAKRVQPRLIAFIMSDVAEVLQKRIPDRAALFKLLGSKPAATEQDEQLARETSDLGPAIQDLLVRLGNWPTSAQNRIVVHAAIATDVDSAIAKRTTIEMMTKAHNFSIPAPGETPAPDGEGTLAPKLTSAPGAASK